MPSRPFDLTGKVILVTGGNEGIGLAAATGLANAGADVAIWGRRVERNQQARAQLDGQGPGRVFTDAVDVGSEPEVAAGFDRLVAEWGRVDAVFVNAGIRSHSPSFLDITKQSREQLFGINFWGAWHTLTAAISHMAGRADRGDPGGSIIVNGSLSALRGLAGGEHYAAAKGALLSVTKGLAAEYGRKGVRVNMICPGPIEREGGGRMREELAARGPIPRYGRPDEIAGIVVYLASAASSYHTGDVITIDGGWTARV